MGVLCAGSSAFRHTISNAVAMTNLTAEMHLSDLPLHASRLIYEHRTCQIVPAVKAKLNPLRGKKIGLARRKIGFVPVHDAVPVVQRVSACWHSGINVEVCINTKRAFAAAPINSEEQSQYLCKCEHVGSDGCIKHRQQNQKARFFNYMVDHAVWGFKCWMRSD